MVADLKTEPETESERLTVAEAASLIRVSESAILRFIELNLLRSHCSGPQQVAIARDDLVAFMRRAHPSSPFLGGGDVPLDAPVSRRSTPEEVEYGLAVMDEAERLSKEIMARHGIERFEPEGWVLLDEARAERDKQLNDLS